ncbi:plasmid recombination protein [Stakelama marina]|uniref:Plasmid recombination protein n=1 Tax=Stakelama marina TaxID=2826939 RepID=A0A8T4IAA0_9SPHN|nr:plasmid recombination protein [Stakelama marina]MBR0551062.1 plasmid recombination protein [Stakelama marina]
MSHSNETPAGKNYAIMRVERIYDLGEMRRVEQHNTRERLSENVEVGGPEPRELLADGPPDVLDRAHERMAECGLDLGAVNGAVGVEVVLTTSHAWWLTATEQVKEDWVDANMTWLATKFGRALLSAKLHEDEKTPHIHAVALAAVCKVDGVRGPKPKTEEGWARRREEEARRRPRWRWNYRDLFGKDNDQLSLEQDRYHEAVAHLGLERGERGQEIPDLEIADGVIVPAGRLSRGKRRDGTNRPRKRITTKQYQAGAREARALAAEQLKLANEDREAAAAARIEAEKNAASHAREMAELKAATEADRAAAERLRAELQAATKAAKDDEENAATNARAQAQARRRAEAELAAAEEDRAAAAAANRNFNERRALHAAQLALLAKAADDENGLDLRPGSETFVMRTARMTDDERAVNSKPWSPVLIAAARAIATALEQLRLLARRLTARETEVGQREEAVRNKELKLEQERSDHERQVAGLERRRVTIEADEARAEATAKAAAETLASARATEANADAALSAHRKWLKVITALERHSDWIEVEGDDRMRLLSDVKQSAQQELVATFDEPAPRWAVSLVRQRKGLVEALKRADERERQAAYATERLTDMIKDVDQALTPKQRTEIMNATRVARQLGVLPDDFDR